MAKRYPRNTHNVRKSGRQQRYRTRQRSPQWLWLLGGILIGLIIPGIIYFQHTKSTVVVEEEPIRQVEALKSADPKKASLKKNQLAEGKFPCPKKASPTSSHAHYDFYDLLASQDCETKKDSQPIPPPAKQFHLEIAIFQTFTDADELKAELALGGFDNVNIVKSIQDDQAVYKVMAGPFDSKASAEKAQKQLKEAHNVAGTVTASEK